METHTHWSGPQIESDATPLAARSIDKSDCSWQAAWLRRLGLHPVLTQVVSPALQGYLLSTYCAGQRCPLKGKSSTFH